MMLELLLYNKMAQEGNPMPFLTNQLSNKETSIMTDQKIPKFLGQGKNLTGQRFGRLVAIEPIAKRQQNGNVVWKCVCDCGNKLKVDGASLRSGSTKSCGCFQREKISNLFKTHGMEGTPIYRVWRNMIARCENQNKKEYKNYGGRGITVCQRWRNSFEAFYADVGDKPEGKSLDRWPDNDGNYEPANWRWADRHEQRVNSRPALCGPHKQCWFRAWHKDSMAQYLSNNQCEFERKHGLSNGKVSACLLGKRKQHKGWIFKSI